MLASEGLPLLPSLQCDFFKRTRYYWIMPKYHAVRNPGGGALPTSGSTLPTKKHWVTSCELGANTTDILPDRTLLLSVLFFYLS